MSTTSPSAQPSDPASKRQQLRLEQEKAAKEQRIRKVISLVGVGLIAVALIGGIIWGVMALGSASKKSAAAGVNSQYTVLVGKTDAPVIIDIYQDYMCPYCGEFERANGTDLAALIDSGKAAVRIHPMAFLDDSSLGTKYSTRAANDLVTVMKAEPDKVLAFNTALYANQPAEKTTGLTDTQIADLAKKAGVSQATVDTFTQLANASFVTSSTQAAFADGITSTPTVLVNGTAFKGDLYTAGPLKTAVLSAAN
jgi:protein-disulfide isomerase